MIKIKDVFKKKDKKKADPGSPKESEGSASKEWKFDQDKVVKVVSDAECRLICCVHCKRHYKVALEVNKSECPGCGNFNGSVERGIFYAETVD